MRENFPVHKCSACHCLMSLSLCPQCGLKTGLSFSLCLSYPHLSTVAIGLSLSSVAMLCLFCLNVSFIFSDRESLLFSLSEANPFSPVSGHFVFALNSYCRVSCFPSTVFTICFSSVCMWSACSFFMWITYQIQGLLSA